MIYKLIIIFGYFGLGLDVYFELNFYIMPVKDEISVEQETNQAAQPQTQQPVREITLTDRLNKRLLQSFLTRINQDGQNFNFQQEAVSPQESNNGDDNDFK